MVPSGCQVSTLVELVIADRERLMVKVSDQPASPSGQVDQILR